MANSVPPVWTDSLLTGVAEIDLQHQVLVDILSEARGLLSGDSGAAQFERMTRDLLAYAIYHFAAEERLMQQSGYFSAAPGDYENHLARHRYFSERVVALRDEVRLGKKNVESELLSFLEAWLIHHIQSVDKALGQFVAASALAPMVNGVEKRVDGF